MNDTFSFLWQSLIPPENITEEPTRREYTTRVILWMMGLVVAVAFIPIIVGFLLGVFDLYPVVVMLILTAVIGFSHWLSKPNWRLAALIPPTLFLVYGVYNSVVSGIGNTSSLPNAIALILTAMLFGSRRQWIVLGIMFLVHILVGVFQYPINSAPLWETLLPRGSMLLGIALLQTLSVALISRAISQARQATELAQKTAETIQEQKSQLSLITQNMMDTVGHLDAQFRTLYISPSVERSFGFKPEAILGQAIPVYLHPDDRSLLAAKILNAIQQQDPSFRTEARFQKANGDYLWVEADMRILYGENAAERSPAFDGIIFSARDIQARKQIEADRQKLINELSAKNTELEQFTYTVSHDLKSPLVTIRGFLSFLKKDILASDEARALNDIDRIISATEKMQRLLQELLDLSRIGRVVNPMTVIPFGEIVAEALERVRGQMDAHKVQITMAPNLPDVCVDRSRMVQAMQNLLDNAAKFSGSQTEPRIEIGIRPGTPPVFTVRDNGIGIDLNHQDRIFHLFNKLDANAEGTGIGLALVKRIIETHQGKIWVESPGLGGGSTFCFTLGVEFLCKPGGANR
jgi:PAS domain S-box-containing protein